MSSDHGSSRRASAAAQPAGPTAPTRASAASTRHRPPSATARGDILVRLSRSLLYTGMFLLPMIDIRASHSLDVSDAVFAIAAVALVLSVRPPVRAPKTPGWFLGVLLLVVGGLIASFDAISPIGSLQVMVNGVFVLVVWQWTSRQLLDTRERTRRAMGAYVLGASTSAAVAVLQSLLHTSLGVRQESATASRVVGLAQQPNIAAVTFALAIVFGIAIVMEQGAGRYRFRLGCLVVLGLALMFTGSVSGMAAVLAGVVLLMVRRGIRLRRLVAVGVILVGVYMAGTAIEGHHGHSALNPFSRLQATTGQNTGYNTVDPRIQTMKAVFSKVAAQPLVGRGLDLQSSLVYYNPYEGVWYPTHDIVLLYWYQGGIVFLAGAVIVTGSAFRRLARVPRSPTSDALLCGAITVLIYSLAGPELFDRWLWLPFVLAMTLRGAGGLPSEQTDADTLEVETTAAEVAP
jgi:hypothetical protein